MFVWGLHLVSSGWVFAVFVLWCDDLDLVGEVVFWYLALCVGLAY